MEAKKAYDEILTALKKHKDICIFDVDDLERKAKFHLFGIELKEKYGLNVEPKNINSLDYNTFGDHACIAWYGEKYRRTVSWSDDGKQPTDEYLFHINFPTGAYIFGSVGGFNKDYPTDFFQKFWLELKSFNPDYCDTHNHGMYWKIENAKTIFNSFNSIVKKYYELNKEDAKQRRIEKLKKELEEVEKSF